MSLWICTTLRLPRAALLVEPLSVVLFHSFVRLAGLISRARPGPFEDAIVDHLPRT